MNTPPLRSLFVTLAFLVAALHTTASNTSAVSTQGNDTYSITVKATHKFTRNTDKLRAQAEAAAQEFCTTQGKILQVVSIDGSKKMYLVGDFANVTLTFKAVNPGDATLAANVTVPDKPTVTPSAETEQLYADLLRLDDLHKKGILTDEEFAAEKKKVLARSR